jgi:RNA polymerase sigma factor (TIGR02999 family)
LQSRPDASHVIDTAQASLTLLLNQAANGDVAARERAFERIYAELHTVARRLMLGERSGHTLGATALVHELYLRVFVNDSAGWADREQFLRYARTAMSHLLIDHARRRNSQRRGGALHSLADEPDHGDAGDGDALVDLDEALQSLARINPRAARVLELRCLAGLEVEQTASVLGISERTVCRDWDMARGLLSQMLAPAHPPQTAGSDDRRRA